MGVIYTGEFSQPATATQRLILRNLLTRAGKSLDIECANRLGVGSDRMSHQQAQCWIRELVGLRQDGARVVGRRATAEQRRIQD